MLKQTKRWMHVAAKKIFSTTCKSKSIIVIRKPRRNIRQNWLRQLVLRPFWINKKRVSTHTLSRP